MCVNDLRTQEIEFGQGNILPDSPPGFTRGLLFFPGQAAVRRKCKDETIVMIPKVMGVAAHMRDADGNAITNDRVVMLAYLADNWRMQSLLKDKSTAYDNFTALLQRKFIGGFGDGDAGTREMYATNFGAGFPASTPAYGGSDNAYAVVIQWEVPTAELGKNICLIDWGYDKSMGFNGAG